MNYRESKTREFNPNLAPLTFPFVRRPMTSSAVSKLTVTPELALEFLATFSRLEYALKVTRFRCSGEGEAKADWASFSAEIDTLLKPESDSSQRATANYEKHSST